MGYRLQVARLSVTLLCASVVASQAQTIPHLERRAAATQLIVDGKPFLVLGGELHNSSSSSVDYMKAVWPRLVAMHVNTVVLPIAWETIEPQEGKFDFANVDGLIEAARRNNLKLVPLWFGAWKNTYSSYVPAWVKTDEARFPRVQTGDGRGTERLSPFSTAVRDADGKAFANLMHHLREIDGDQHTVIMVQVENEVGVIPESRDHSAVANAAFAAAVPPSLMSYIEKHRATLNPNSAPHGRPREASRPAHGSRSSAGSPSRTISSWHGSTPPSPTASQQPASENTRCPCMPTPP